MGLFGVFKRKKSALAQEKQKWNKLWDLWAEEKADSPYAELMTYQAEVNNGGHDQYFFNVGNVRDLKEELAVLKQILPETHKANLEKAYMAYLAMGEDQDNAEAVKVLKQCDTVFWENETEINLALEKYVATIEL